MSDTFLTLTTFLASKELLVLYIRKKMTSKSRSPSPFQH